MAKLQPRDLLVNQGEFGTVEKALFREDLRTKDFGLFLHVERQHAVAFLANNWLKRRHRPQARMAKEAELAEKTGTSTVLLRRKLRGEIVMTARDLMLLAHHTGHTLELQRVS